MDCSSEEALKLFFDKWRSEDTRLVLVVDKGGSEDCRVVETSVAQSPSLIRVKLTSGEAVLDLSGAKFSYEDWRAGLVPELVERNWVCFLLLEFASGRSLVLADP